MSLLRGGGGAYARDKNTSVRVCAKNVGGAYARGGAYLRDTTVLYYCVVAIVYYYYSLPSNTYGYYALCYVVCCSITVHALYHLPSSFLNMF